MMNAVYEELKALHENEMHSNVLLLADMFMSTTEYSTNVIDSEIKIKIMIYYAVAAYHTGKYRKAEKWYSLAAQNKKLLGKAKGSSKQNDSQNELISDAEIKYRLHLCYIKMNCTDQAIKTLQTISAKQRNAKINMAIAKLCHNNGLDRLAITAYKDVLKERPLALEASDGLAKLGVKPSEITSYIMSNEQFTSLEWLNTWIKASYYANTFEIESSIIHYKRLLEETSPVKNNPQIKISLAEVYYYKGDITNAKKNFQQAFHADKTDSRGYAIASSIYLSERASNELEKLIPIKWQHSEECDSEMWTALACLVYSNSNNVSSSLSTAAYFAQKACILNPRNVEALIVKGCILSDIGKLDNAITHFREAWKISPYRYEPHKGLVDCYISLSKLKDALTIAENCCKVEKKSPRSLTLYAIVLLKDPANNNKVKQILEDVCSKNDVYLPAVYLLVQLYGDIADSVSMEAAINLLQKTIRKSNAANLHQLLAELYTRQGDDEKATQCYSEVLRIEPNNTKAHEGINRVGSVTESGDASGQMKLGVSYNQSSSDTEGGDHDNTYEVHHSDSEHYMSDD